MGLAIRSLDLPIWVAKQAADIEGMSEVGQTGSDGSHSRSLHGHTTQLGLCRCRCGWSTGMCRRETPPKVDLRIVEK